MNLQPVCLPKSSHCQHSKYHIAPLFTLSYMFNDFNSTECTSKLRFQIVPPKQCRLNTLCHSELSLKFDPIASRAGHHKVLLSRFTCPILRIFGCPRNLLKVAFFSTLQHYAPQFQHLCLFISTTKKPTYKMFQGIHDDFVGKSHLASIKILVSALKILFYSTKTYNIWA